MSRHRTILRFCRPAGNHHIFADVRPCLGLCPGSGHAQRPSSTQVANQLPLESASALDIESLVNGFVRDAHRFVIREVGPQPVGNLFRRPAIDPFPVAAMRFVSANERRLPRSRNLTTISVANLAFKAVLYIVP
jgi:hypothetical protein